ncbi:hypothetical protein [Sphingobacterium tabacisoli]|uniref:hypothetical protein n=1 Tax=Sphingobacterium tabacisoli TaxID=2044855 RepID=UPI0036D3503E
MQKPHKTATLIKKPPFSHRINAFNELGTDWHQRGIIFLVNRDLTGTLFGLNRDFIRIDPNNLRFISDLNSF